MTVQIRDPFVAADPAHPVFMLRAPDHAVSGKSIHRRLPPGGTGTLGARVRDFFAAAPDGIPMLVGAIPFDPAAPDFLFQPRALDRQVEFPPALAGRPLLVGTVASIPSREDFKGAVQEALRLLGDPASDLRKVVLSRTLRLSLEEKPDVLDLAARLASDPNVAVFVTSLSEDTGEKARLMVGATPELLVSRRGRKIVSHPLAGSARRSRDDAVDRAAAASLQDSEKDRREHALVVECILDCLAPHCRSLSAPPRPALQATAAMWHLGTRIEGEIADAGMSAAALAALLHPTPAVGGFPRPSALAAIRRLEAHDRGFYAGALGWVDAHGDGSWYVTLRCAELQANEACLYAGVGIVSGSDPSSEAAETCAKLQTMLRAMGLCDSRL